MPPERLKIVVFHPRAEAYKSLLTRAAVDAEIVVAKDEAALASSIEGAQVLLTLTCPPVVIEHGGALRWIQAASAGIDPLLARREALRDIAVTNARGIHADHIGDYAMAAMLMLLWDMPGLLRHQAERVWHREPKPALAGRTLGVAGLGALGQGIVRRARASGMEVIGLSRGGAPVEGVSQVYRRDELEEMLPRCDFLALVVPGTPETERMIDARALGLMKPGAFLVNLARGSVVDEAALVAALEGGRLAGAALDVFETEPLPAASPLWAMPNVIVTPHVAGMSDDYDERVLQIFLDNLARFRRGEALRNRVDLSRGY
ncbi:D-2-hydroxyacid dehydrogenase [Ancylobacter sp. MQZ15Z-1]|uniref:D-2-hydroxyacid dehydrogenase n=1 Tax=Ancylobacter mangrovi TaxID=2972472 RepID=A0A9X2PFD5_9HYPH|nr:D-2-hydroxyacid dehydrogenase [Ancylobacter mangrovi]MCS0494462.1 D-2-hydroxyacid dehydrogenase [Ancylobacter mangrovi]